MDKQSSERLKRLKKRRATLKGGITRNSNKARGIIEQYGSRTVLNNLKQRIVEALNEIKEVKEEIIKLPGIVEENKAEAEEWYYQVRENAEEIIDEIDAHVEARANEAPSNASGFHASKTVLTYCESSKGSDRQSDEEGNSVTGENSEDSDGFSHDFKVEAKVAAFRVKQEKARYKEKCRLQAQEAQLKKENARLKLKEEKDEAARLRLKAKLRDKYQSKEKADKKIKQEDDCIRKEKEISGEELTSDSSEDEGASDTNDSEAEHCDPKELDSLFRGLKKPQLAVFSGDKELYHDWRAQFDIFVNETRVPSKTKMMLLKSSLTGKPLKIIEKLGYTATQYQTALEKLDLKYGGQKRLLQRHLAVILQTPEVPEDNLKELEIFSDRLTDIVAKLKDYGQRRELHGVSALYTAVQQKIPETLLVSYQQWAHERSKDDGLSTFSRWLAQQVVYRMDAEETKERSKRRKEEKNTGGRVKKTSVHTATARAETKCPVCEGHHKLVSCKRWEETAVKERWATAKRLRLCYRCLNTGHRGKDCRSKSTCNVNGCQGTHHFHLHFEKSQESEPEVKTEQKQGYASKRTVEKEFTAPEAVMLRTIPVWLHGSDGRKMQVNAFLDDGSDTTYLRHDVAVALGLQTKEKRLNISTLTKDDLDVQSHEVAFDIESLDGHKKATICAFTLEEMCKGLQIPQWNRHKQKWAHLADISFPKLPGRKVVDILIGADNAELSLSLEERIGKPGEPVARRTPLGWTCVGRLPGVQMQGNTAYVRTYRAQLTANVCLDEDLRRIWEDDLIGVKCKDADELSDQEKLAVRKAQESLEFRGDRYEIAIPWKEDTPSLPDNRKRAEERLVSLEKRLLKTPEVAERYKDVMSANIDKGYARKVEIQSPVAGPAWYLPHFPVIREDKETTKVRIVFDSAAKEQSICLNDAMLTGPKLQKDVIEVLLRFREKPVAMVADIKEMFSQVILAEKDRRYHRFLWRDLDQTKPIEVYEAVRLTFGDRASPYLAQFVMRSHAEKHREEFPLAAAVVLSKMYMDDVLESTDTEEEAREVREQLTELLSRGGFQIRRWCSNKTNVLAGIREEDRATGVKVEESELPCVKTLGVEWNAAGDAFQFMINSDVSNRVLTKRGLLSRIATLFDPLQFLAPFTIRAKMALQEAWLQGLAWDEDLPDDLAYRVSRWIQQMPQLAGTQIQRCLRREGRVNEVSLHTFTDASSKAYAAVTYIRHEYESGNVTVSFVAAKAKVAPIRSISIPRLELMAAVVGARLSENISNVLAIPKEKCVFWTDSMDVVFWVHGQSRRQKPFVANRVSEIHQKTSPLQWRHVPGRENCADDATRGLEAEELTKNSRWFQGPAFLHLEEEAWPAKRHAREQDCSEDAKNETPSIKLTFQGQRRESCLSSERFSDWTRLLRVTAWILRFVSRTKEARELTRETCKDSQEKHCQGRSASEVQPNTPVKCCLEAEELKVAEKYWLQQAQAEVYPAELDALKRGESIPIRSTIKQLTPFLDREGIMRVGGRLERSQLPYDTKHPVILPKGHSVSRHVVQHVHKRGNHGRGVNCVFAELRQRYWVIHGREEVKKAERECNLCKIRRKRKGEQIMAPLPEARLGVTMRCFARCCVDYAGPFVTKLTRRVTAKRYLCLFTCAATRAVHLEIAYSLDTDSFLNALSRMIARRGKPEEMISDNGTNFTAADNELRQLVGELDQQKIQDKATNEGIKWRFNPPTGSHHGGVFEALIKSAKRSLKAILGHAGITDEELHTAIVEVEGLMNARPLTYPSSDPSDEPALTPNHFISGQAGGELAPQGTEELAFNPRKRWRFVQDLTAQAWRRWMKEYLTVLNTRSKWMDKRRNLAVGDVVLMVDQNNPKGKWPLGRVEEVFPGADGCVRVVKVKSKDHVYIRPITKLCPLDIV